MLFFYIRHGDPIYDPDSLTPKGHLQAQAIAKRLALFGIDEIYASTSNRAIQTARPTCDILRKEPVLLDFCNEGHAWRDFAIEIDGSRKWVFHHKSMADLFADPSVRELHDKWYEHPEFAGYDFKKGIDRITSESDRFFASLGYRHINGTGSYRVTAPSEKRVALFAHQGFGLTFFSCLLDIPIPVFTRHFDFSHSSMTVIHFRNEGDICHPQILTLSNDSHIYREGLPMNYNNGISF